MRPNLRTLALAGLLAVGGGLCIGASSARAQVVGGPVAGPVVPRYYYSYGGTYYAPGYYGATNTARGYYYGGGYYGAPGYPGGGTVNGFARDWSTGRNLPLAKPWMRPLR